MPDDPELNALIAIKQAMDQLDESARERTLIWLRHKYPLGNRTAAREPVTSSAQISSDTTRESSLHSVGDLPTLYSLANPVNDSDKVLVIGYWFQHIRGETELDSQSLNTALKNLGYPISNITRAVSMLTSTTPRLMLQTKKAGSTQQARKRFRLTVEGIRRVEQMLGGPVPGVARTGSGMTTTDDTEA